MARGTGLVRWLAAAALVSAAAATPVLAQTTLKMAYALSETSHYGVAAAAFSKSLAASDPDFKIQQFPNSQLGGEREVIEGLQLGTIDMAIVSTGATLNFVPQTGVFDIPFLFRDLAHAHPTVHGGLLDPPEGVGLADLQLGHQHPLGAIDRLTGLEPVAQVA